MPMYEFRCRSCGQVFEELCRHDENGEALTCPHCGTTGQGRRLISVFAAHGLENGHHGVGKRWGSAASGAKGDSESKGEGGTATKTACGPSCGCAADD